MANSDEIRRYLGATDEAVGRFAKQVVPVIARLEEERSKFIEVFKPFEQDIRRAQEKASQFALAMSRASETIAPFIVDLNRAIGELPARTREELEVLASHGWYLDPEMPFTAGRDLTKLFQQGLTEDANGALEQYFQSSIDSIERRLRENCPARSAILSEAFNAHRAGWYGLSVPVFLAQADGVCAERLKINLYKKTKGGTSTTMADLLSDCEPQFFREAMLTPFLKPFPIVFGRADRREDDLNRHAVLHGESTNYNTLRNSCKAMSLLVFADWIIGDFKQE